MPRVSPSASWTTSSERGFFYHLEPYTHRYPHCWRCGTPLLFRVVDEWYISMGPVYDKPRNEVTAEEKAASLRYQIMDVVDEIKWIPGFGYERELDWLRTMARLDDQQEALLGSGAAHLGMRVVWLVRRGRRPRGAEAASGRGLGGVRGPYAAPTVRGRGEDRVLSHAAQPTSRIKDVGNPWLDAGIVPFSTHALPDRSRLLAQVVPGRLHHRVVPGPVPQLVLLDARHEHCPAQRAAVQVDPGLRHPLCEDGRAMHKSWGNSIEFDEAAERMGVDVMRWMFAKQKPEDNILFGYGTADEARRELLVLWNVYAFFVTYAGLAAWTPQRGVGRDEAAGLVSPRSLDPFASRGPCQTSWHGAGRL